MRNDNNLLRSFARDHRKSPTWGERKLWNLLRGRQLLNFKFRRQHILFNYIVDFCCPEVKLVIEIDGGSHNEDRFEKDKKREEFLRAEGYEVVRFTEREVLSNLDSVLTTLTLILFLKGEAK